MFSVWRVQQQTTNKRSSRIVRATELVIKPTFIRYTPRIKKKTEVHIPSTTTMDDDMTLLFGWLLSSYSAWKERKYNKINGCMGAVALMRSNDSQSAMVTGRIHRLCK